MTSEQQTPDRSFGQAVILHFTVFCVLLIPSQHLSGLGGVQRKLAFQFFQGGEFGFRPQEPDRHHFHFLPVNVPRLAEQMRFQQQFPPLPSTVGRTPRLATPPYSAPFTRARTA